MFCPECGTKNEDDALFCENCGTKLVEETPTTPQQAAPSNQATPSDPYASYMAPRKKTPIGVIIAIIAVFVILAGSIGGYLILSNITDPKHVVEKYAKAFTSKDSDGMFDSLKFPSSPFLTKEAFKRSLETNENLGYGEATDYTIDSSSILKTDTSRTYRIELHDAANAFSNTQRIQVIKQGSKSFLFFDNWKIKTDSFLSKNCGILVPTGSKVTIDGVELKEDQKKADSDRANSDLYQINYLFAGKHTLKVTSELFDDYNQEFSTTANDYNRNSVVSVSTNNLTLSQDLTNQLGETSKTIFSNIYSCGLEGKPFADVVSGTAVVADSSANMETGYNNIVENNMKDKDRKLTGLTVNVVNPQASLTYSDDDSLAVQVTLSISYQAKSKVKEFFGNKVQSKTYDGNADYRFVYHYIDGQWQLYSSSAFDYVVSYSRY